MTESIKTNQIDKIYKLLDIGESEDIEFKQIIILKL